MTRMKPSVVLSKYFNRDEGKKSAAEFAKEVKELSSDEKVEIVEAVAAELGVEVEWPAPKS